MENIQDGSAAFKIRDLREEKLKQKMVDLVYPVGIVVAIANDNKPDFMNYGKWEKVAPDRVLWGAGKHTPGTIIAAGLPNITGEATGVDSFGFKSNGALSKGDYTTIYIQGTGASGNRETYLKIDASLSNPIYGNSTTVQPDAYVVTYWQRTE